MMLMLITYDVNVTSEGGQRRLRKISRTCLDYGMRVQFSVFECEVTPDQWVALRSELEKIYNPQVDSLRYYFLGKRGRQRVVHMGAKMVSDPVSDALIL